MTLQLHRSDGKGSLKATSGRDPKWRAGLHARRWRAASLGNSEMNPTSRPAAVLFWVGLAALTFALLMVGYRSHFWR
jgi:hypothetical protein